MLKTIFLFRIPTTLPSNASDGATDLQPSRSTSSGYASVSSTRSADANCSVANISIDCDPHVSARRTAAASHYTVLGANTPFNDSFTWAAPTSLPSRPATVTSSWTPCSSFPTARTVRDVHASVRSTLCQLQPTQPAIASRYASTAAASDPVARYRW